MYSIKKIIPFYTLIVFLAITSIHQSDAATDREIWDFIQTEALKIDIDPTFIYSIAFAESSLNPWANTPRARGIMQIKRGTWYDMTSIPYYKAWNWKINIKTGILYLNYCKKYLKKYESFSYPLLAACYRYGPNAVRKSEFNLKNLEMPKNKIYKKIFSGDNQPIEEPVSRTTSSLFNS